MTMTQPATATHGSRYSPCDDSAQSDTVCRLLAEPVVQRRRYKWRLCLRVCLSRLHRNWSTNGCFRAKLRIPRT